MNEFYKDYSEYLSEIFPGIKVQKISVNAGFTCPNRDGTIGTGGCIYCNNTSFTPSYCMEILGEDIPGQIEKGKAFFSGKYPKMKYLAYFQSFTNTYRNVKELEKLYKEALNTSGVIGLVIGTRPDMFSEEIAGMLGKLNVMHHVFVEFGAETSSDETLKRINRGHTFTDTCHAVRLASREGLHVGLHLIAGLPGEDEEDVVRNVSECCKLPIESLKLHHLQVIKDTPLSRMWHEGKIKLNIFDVDRYIELCCRLVNIIPRQIAIERFLASSPQEMVDAPKWGLKNYEFTNRLLVRLRNEKI